MENCTQQPQGYCSQLETIKAIEGNLSLLKSRISFLQKQEGRTVQQIEKAFTASTPIIKAKINQTLYSFKHQAVNSLNKQILKQKVQEMKASRIQHEEQLMQKQTSLYKSKQHDSFHIREMSKKNQSLIAEAKREWAEEKKKKSELVKVSKMLSRRRIQEFNMQRQQSFERMRHEQKEELERRIQRVAQQLRQVEKEQQLEHSRNQEHLTMLNRLKQVIDFLKYMKPDQFAQVMRQLQISNKVPIDQQLTQSILIHLDKQRESMLESGSKFRQQGKKHSSRHKSESLDVKAIYGSTVSYKKIR